MTHGRQEIRIDVLLISCGTKHHQAYQNKESVTRIQLCLLDRNFFVFTRKRQMGLTWIISLSLPYCLFPLIFYEEIVKSSKVFIVCSCLYTTQSHLYLLLTFFKPFLLPSITFSLFIHLLHIILLPEFRLSGLIMLSRSFFMSNTVRH